MSSAAAAHHPSEPESATERLAAALEHVRHLLPAQGPLQGFVHHNTLHAFEHLPFHQGVLEASRCFGAEPFERDDRFVHHLAIGRIAGRDIDAVLRQDQVDDEPVIPGGPGRRTLRKLRCEQLFEIPEREALQWWLEESDVRRRLHSRVSEEAGARMVEGADVRATLRRLWDALASASSPRIAPRVVESPRPRDRMLARTGFDTDECVHPVLQRFAAAYVDQGLAYWVLPERSRGLFHAFVELYQRPVGPPDPWMRGLTDTLVRYDRELRSAEDVILATLRDLEVPEADWSEVITRTLLSLGGWAGIVQQLETESEWAPVIAPPAKLVDYLAIQLVLDHQAYSHADAVPERDWRSARLMSSESSDLLVYEGFVVAQLAGIPPRLLADRDAARMWLDEIAEFGPLARRWTLQRALERNYYGGVLDSMLAHAALGPVSVSNAPARPIAQLAFCIDDREESLRRHLEEHSPELETLGYAGFFSLAIRFLGLDAIRPRQMCPIVVTPRHLIIEEPVDPSQAIAHATRRRRFGQLQHASFVGGRTFFRGGLLSLGIGLIAMIPLIARTLAPRTAARIGNRASRAALTRPRTRLRLERPDQAMTDIDGMYRGFTVAEMATIVETALETMGLSTRLAPLVVLVAHGSDSLNNPHGAAYSCGACSGGNGGPNSRGFADIANRQDVRALLQERGIVIPDGTWFLAAYHDTCSDEFEYYDLERVPEQLLDAVAQVQRALRRAATTAAHERIRRFMSASLELTPDQALAHVEARAVDLAQPRPELGHVTNAICFVGRRETTRGLFLDRRAFLVSWDPTTDPTGVRLGPLLQAVGPVGAGINLEYLFSYLDNDVYGCGSKLPHNVAGLIGVMDGHSSDLRTGLPRQMIEIHEPVRLLTIIEAEPELLLKIGAERPMVGQLIVNEWITTIAWSPSTGKMHRFRNGGFEPYEPESTELRIVARSIDHYRGHRDHLPCVRIDPEASAKASPR